MQGREQGCRAAELADALCVRRRRPEMSVVSGVSQVACFCVSVLYPLYTSALAIESGSKADDTQWLSYWVVYAGVQGCEALLGLVDVPQLPLYHEAKFALLFWLVSPRFSGALYLYQQFARPLLLALRPDLKPGSRTRARVEKASQPLVVDAGGDFTPQLEKAAAFLRSHGSEHLEQAIALAASSRATDE